MLALLLSIPFLAIAISIGLYRLNGKKEILRLDLVQFYYAFIISPVLFIWAKSLIYLLVRTELDIRLSQGEIFLIDTAFSTAFLYLFAFIVMHSLTKSFNLKVGRDPLHDLFHHSEYFHLWLTHLVMYIGGLGLLTAVGIFNAWVPFQLEMSRWVFYLLVASGIPSGILVFISVWLSDPKQDRANFMRLMKLAFGVFFLAHTIVYFVQNPGFNADAGIYWWTSILFATTVVCSFFAYKSTKAKSLFENLSDWFKHHKWSTRVQV